MVRALQAEGRKIAGYSSALLGPPRPLHGLPLPVANGAIPAPEPHLRPLQLCPAGAAWERRDLSHLHHPHCLWSGTLAPLAPLTMWEPHQWRASPRKPGGLPASRRWPCLGLRSLPHAMGSYLPEPRRLQLLQGVLGRRWPAWTTWQCLPLWLGPRPGLEDTAPSSGEGCAWHHCCLQPSHCMSKRVKTWVRTKILVLCFRHFKRKSATSLTASISSVLGRIENKQHAVYKPVIFSKRIIIPCGPIRKSLPSSTT